MLINQLGFPGLGTIMAGRRIGYLQAAIMVAGFFLLMGFMVWYFFCLLRYLMMIIPAKADYVAEYHRLAWAGWWGLGLSAFAWCWALLSSLGLLRRGSLT